MTPHNEGAPPGAPVPTIDRFTAKLPEFFPPDHSYSPWLLRLAIIRDDLDFELKGLVVERDDGPEELWRSCYFIRRMSISILEASNIFAFEVATLAKKGQRDGLVPGLSRHLQDVDAFLRSKKDLLTTLRDAISAHVRPQNVDKSGECVEARVIRNHPEWQATVALDLESKGHATSYRQLTLTSTLFAWPKVETEEDVNVKLGEIQKAILGCTGRLIHTIDAVLITFWLRLGIVKAPDGYELGLRYPAHETTED